MNWRVCRIVFRLSGLTSLIEPILIVVLGVVIGGMVIAMFLPIFKMSDIVNPKR